ncbi:DUF7344 domain-containing protein [Natronosalvus rutilus]|uniref:DUF7344 domain-containing protein n=1 Tax=Natronosalvus rutilus TaxID=2953753 RepID=A0A9E7N5T6_9EURY|nr:hypothetical protein [Natronosalvus rutilus]UTF52274.1 hypothetical protein NGM29_10760 [Natronosalvus rutilus]
MPVASIFFDEVGMPMSESPYHIARGSEDELDKSLRALAHSTRRRLLQRLSRENDNIATIDELCDTLLTDDPEKLTSDDVKIALLHRHLPMLSDVGVVDIDWERETVRYQDGHRIDSLLGQLLASAEA